MKARTWKTHNWTFGEKPLDCHAIKVGRGTIYLHLRESMRKQVEVIVYNMCIVAFD